MAVMCKFAELKVLADYLIKEQSTFSSESVSLC